jgi:hypothetical protein
MKKVLAIACLVLLFVAATVVTASAAENNWRFNIYADNGAGMFSSSAQFGVKTGAKDPLPSDVLPLSDLNDNKWSILLPTNWTVAGVFPIDYAGTKTAWSVDIKSPLLPFDSAYASQGNRKIWDLRVAGAGTAVGSTVRLRFQTVAANMLPPKLLTQSVGPPAVQKPAGYYLKMVNNWDKEGAPANGTIWVIPIPTAHSTTPYFILTLPALNISVEKSETKLISEGYEMQFYQTPEPSSLLALGAGLMGLAGFASKRRRG